MPIVMPDWEDIAARLSMTQPHPIQVSVTPLVRFLFEPTTKTVGLVTNADDPKLGPPRHPARGLRVQRHGEKLVGVWIEDQALVELGWRFLLAMGERLMDGESFASAIDAEVDRWLDLVAPVQQTSRSAALGALGELAVLRAALATGHDASAWVGGGGGPHDFRIGDVDVEVKTTTGEGHTHLIHGASQLLPAVGHELAVISIVLLPAESGSGSSVANVVGELAALGLSRDWLARFLRQERGVAVDDAECQQTYVLRFPILAVQVTGGLPVLTPPVLTAIAGDEAWRLSDVQYRLSVEGWPSSEIPVVAEIRDRIVF